MNVTIWHDLHIIPAVATGNRPVSLAIGVFDGVHRGHQRLLERAVADALQLESGVPTVLTFDPNPATVVSPESFPGVLSSLDDRLQLFASHGINETVVLKFSETFAAVAGSQFLETLVTVFPTLRYVVAGFNFHLGHHRDTGPTELESWFAGRGIRVDIVPALKDNEDSISSSRIRRAVAAGDLDTAARLLGRPYRIAVEGVSPGEGFQPRQLLPPPGAYRCTLLGEDFSREGMMEISSEGNLLWEPRITSTFYVIPRSKADVSND